MIDVVPEKVKSAAMTAEWESTLQKIAKGEADDQQFLSDIIAFTKQLIRENAGETSRNENPFRFSRLTVIGKCPNCGKNVYEFPKSYSCEDSRRQRADSIFLGRYGARRSARPRRSVYLTREAPSRSRGSSTAAEMPALESLC